MDRLTSWIPTLVDAGAKGVLLLLAVFIVTRMMRNATAASRHLAWAAGILVLIALPILSAMLPRIEVEVPMPAPTIEQEAAPAPAGAPQHEFENSDRPNRAVFASNDAALPKARKLAARLVSGSPDPARDDAVPTCALFSTCTVDTIRQASPAQAFVTVWFIISGILLAKLLLGTLSARRLVRRSQPVRDASWHQLLKDASEMAGVTRSVRLLESTQVGMPVTLGIMQPTIVLPPVATAWSEERRLTVLVHELAHVRRNDVMTCLVARIACALHWMNPLAWRAARRLRDECERACDDFVIRAGMSASAYADDLLDIVRSAGASRSPAVALPMAQRSDFEGRLLAILEPKVPRRAPSRLRSFAVAATVAAIAMPLAAMSPVPTPVGDVRMLHAEETGESSGIGAKVESALNDLGVDVDDIKATVREGVEVGLTNAKTAVEDYIGSRIAGLQEARPQPLPEVRPVPQVMPMPSVQGPQNVGKSKWRAHKDDDHDSELNGRAVVGLAAALRDSDPHVRKMAAEALGGIEDPRAIEALSRALRTDQNAEVRRMAAWALGEIEDAAAVPALAEALRSDADAEVRRMCAWALGEIESATAVEALGAALKDESAEVRKTAVWALGEIESPNGVPHLIPFLKDENAEIRKQAAWALGEIESPRAVAALAAVINDNDVRVRETAVWALGEIEDRSASDALARALSDANAGVRRKAAWAIGELDLSEAPPALIEATRDSDRDVRKAAAHALGEIGDPAAVPALAVLARGQDNALRYAAMHALAEIRGSAAIEVVVEMLKDPDPEVRKLAAKALGRHE